MTDDHGDGDNVRATMPLGDPCALSTYYTPGVCSALERDRLVLPSKSPSTFAAPKAEPGQAWGQLFIGRLSQEEHGKEVGDGGQEVQSPHRPGLREGREPAQDRPWEGRGGCVCPRTPVPSAKRSRGPRGGGPP